MFKESNKIFLRTFGLILIFVSAVGLSAKTSTTAFAQGSNQECGTCHQIIDEHWQASAHGNSLSDEIFIAAWAEKDNDPECLTCHSPNESTEMVLADREGVTCETCHSSPSDNHPEEIMSTNGSSRLCGTCHLDTHAEWTDSVHGEENLSCNQCHNPHSTEIKGQDSQALCQSCHLQDSHSYDLTAHAEAGLLCVDCHMDVSDSPMGDGHGSRVHSFEVSIDTCGECHIGNLHSDQEADFGAARCLLTYTEAGSGPGQAEILTEPASVSPVGYTILGTLFGVGAGMVTAPWLETWYRRFRD